MKSEHSLTVPKSDKAKIPSNTLLASTNSLTTSQACLLNFNAITTSTSTSSATQPTSTFQSAGLRTLNTKITPASSWPTTLYQHYITTSTSRKMSFTPPPGSPPSGDQPRSELLATPLPSVSPSLAYSHNKIFSERSAPRPESQHGFLGSISLFTHALSFPTSKPPG